MKNRISLMAHNARMVWGIFTGRDAVIGRRDLEPLMRDQLGWNWHDRLFVGGSRLKPGRVDAMIRQASSRSSGRLGPLYELMYYTELDPRIGGLLEKRIGAVTRVQKEIRPGNKDNPQSVEAAVFLEKYIENIRFKSFMEQAMDGRKFGVTGFRNMLRQEGDMWVFSDPSDERQISQSRWWQERSNDSNWGKLYLKVNNDKLFVDKDIHPAQLTLFVNRAKRGYYDTTGFMNRVLRLYVAKIWTLTYMMQTIERFGKPFLWSVLRDRDFRDEEFKDTVAGILRQFSGERWGVFPEGFEMHYMDASSQTQTDMHFRWLKYINTEIAVTILGQNLSTEVERGSFAAATAHLDVAERIIEEDVEWLEEQINDEFLWWILKLNWPDMDPDDYPILYLTPVKDIDLEKVARGYKTLTELIDVPVEEIRAKSQTRPPRSKDGQEYDEEVIGPSTRGRNADALIRALGG